LSRFLDEEKDEIISGMTDAADAITMIIKEESTQSAMNKYNKKAGKNEK
jgi:hypothetical protein